MPRQKYQDVDAEAAFNQNSVRNRINSMTNNTQADDYSAMAEGKKTRPDDNSDPSNIYDDPAVQAFVRKRYYQDI